jgi:hypothetical protein
VGCRAGRLSNHMPLRGLGRTRKSRSVITCALALLQLHISWVTVFHRHESPPFSLKPPTVQEGSRTVPLALEASLLCTACQIVRQGALRPTLSLQAPRPGSAAPLRIAVLRNHLSSLQTIVIFGRAPPLS